MPDWTEPELVSIAEQVATAQAVRHHRDRQDLIPEAWIGVASALERLDTTRPRSIQRSYLVGGAHLAVRRAIIGPYRKMNKETPMQEEPAVHYDLEPDEPDTMEEALERLLNEARVWDPGLRRAAASAWLGAPRPQGVTPSNHRMRVTKVRRMIAEAVERRED